jgi:catechol 2,3-dioxygenase-like lactoylglutathione lyase family enzyme
MAADPHGRGGAGEPSVRDRITANLPARSLDETAAFYAALGFDVGYKGEDWMTMSRGDLELEFFPHPDLDPSSSWHSACVRIADLDGLHRAWSEAGLPAAGVPRMTRPEDQPSGLRMFALVDPNGSLLRCFRLGA